MSRDASAILERALQLSRDVLAAAERGDSQATVPIDAERLQLLQSARRSGTAFGAHEHQLLQHIALLNDQSIGHLEHHRRIKGRQLDVAALGRRAVSAYATTRQVY
jgi:hypothetical protein